MTHAWSQNKNKGSAQHAAIPNPGGRALRKEGGGGGDNPLITNRQVFVKLRIVYAFFRCLSSRTIPWERRADFCWGTRCNTLQHAATHCSTRRAVVSSLSARIYIYSQLLYIYIQPIADRVAQNFEITSKNFRSSTRRTTILLGLIIYYLVLIVNPMGRIWFVEKV